MYIKTVLRRLSISGFLFFWNRGIFAYLFVFSPSGRCFAETANFLSLLVLYWYCPIMIGGGGRS
ncbi:hypothetical protein WRSd3_04443 [Shigella dysenteriae WRSd3]|uniref:Uncharacterized protein n=1 Tax=Shigella dysenteriae WRSd3 TaxID=1401327 RepID=A0A090NA83_SHIDY|nr:hypothetical protein WRSd3_04443 [Shigella dysenteriae WRSd3]